MREVSVLLFFAFCAHDVETYCCMHELINLQNRSNSAARATSSGECLLCFSQISER